MRSATLCLKLAQLYYLSFVTLFSWNYLNVFVNAGCQNFRHCCVGRNLSCVSTEDDLEIRENVKETVANEWHLHGDPEMLAEKGHHWGDFFESLLNSRKLATWRQASEHIPYLNEEFVAVTTSSDVKVEKNGYASGEIVQEMPYDSEDEHEPYNNDPRLRSRREAENWLKRILPAGLVDELENTTFVDQYGIKISAIDLFQLILKSQSRRYAYKLNDQSPLVDNLIALKSSWTLAEIEESSDYSTVSPPEGGQLLPSIRYVIINDHILPTKMEKVGRITQERSKNLVCYCDDACHVLTDCCRDSCRATNCKVSHWSGWTSCEVFNRTTNLEIRNACGPGHSRRYRQVIQESQNGGEPCPVLEESMTCYKSGPACQDVSEVALLLHYVFASARSPGFNNSLYYDIPEALARLRVQVKSCVVFKVTYFNEACKAINVKDQLRLDREVCVECQPAARGEKERCNGEGKRNTATIWSFLHVKHCNGLWIQVQQTQNCSCSDNYPTLAPFIFV